MILDNMIKDIVAACDHFDIESFIPRLAQFLAVPHVPHKRRFLIDWSSLLQSVPDIDMLLYLPQLLDGMMSMLSDTHTEIRSAAGRTLDNFLRQVCTTLGPLNICVLRYFLGMRAHFGSACFPEQSDADVCIFVGPTVLCSIPALHCLACTVQI
jgi:hypothetical protein